MDFTEPCFGIGHNLSLICQMTSEDIKHQLIIITDLSAERSATLVMKKARLQALVYDILSCRKAMLGVWKKGSQLLESFNVCSKLLELFITGPQWSQW